MAGERGILLFAHGSRDPRWREPIEAVARRIVEQDRHVHVACAYLELVEPDLPTAAARMVAEGARDVRVVPLFLGMGKHVREDLPHLVAKLRVAHPAVEFKLQRAVGEEPQLVDLMARLALKDR